MTTIVILYLLGRAMSLVGKAIYKPIEGLARLYWRGLQFVVDFAIRLVSKKN